MIPADSEEIASHSRLTEGQMLQIHQMHDYRYSALESLQYDMGKMPKCAFLAGSPRHI